MLPTTLLVFYLPDSPGPGLPHRVCREVFNLQLVFNLDFLEGSVHPLDADDATVSVEEARQVIIFDVQRSVTVSNVTLKTFIDSYFPSLTCLLFPDDKIFLIQNGCPVESKKV